MDVIGADGGPRPLAGGLRAGPDPPGPDGVDLVRVLDAMPAAFCLLDPEWRFRYINVQAEQLMRRPREEFLGRRMDDVFPATAGSVLERSFHAAVRSGEPVSFEAPYPSGGTEGWYEVRAWPEPGGLAVYFLDVTGRVRAE